MKGLAWDDDPTYLESVATVLRRTYDIDLEVEKTVERFQHRVEREDCWAFLVVDLLDERPANRSRPLVGVDLCVQYSERKLIFLVTREPLRLVTGKVSLPRQVIVKSKELDPGWLALEMVNELKQRGLYINHKKVFLIYGHDRETDGCTNAVENYLRNDLKLEVHKVTPATITGHLLSAILEKMQDAAAFVAICTPDDETSDGSRRPRQNVILEMGMAMGLPKGVQRLIVLQRKGDELSKRVSLPSDYQGLLTLTFQDDVTEKFGDLHQRLKLLRVEGL
jgi:hypothetical protein